MCDRILTAALSLLLNNIPVHLASMPLIPSPLFPKREKVKVLLPGEKDLG